MKKKSWEPFGSYLLKFVFSKKATKIDKIFTVDLTLTLSKRQIDGEDLVNFCGLLREHELYNCVKEKHRIILNF